MVEAYRSQFGFDAISLMLTNLYGPGDNFDLLSSHVLALHKFHAAKLASASAVTLWGTGTALREFLRVDNLAGAAVFLMENYSSGDIINVGSGEETSIAGLALMISEIAGFTGEIRYDSSKLDGTPRKRWMVPDCRLLAGSPRSAFAMASLGHTIGTTSLKEPLRSQREAFELPILERMYAQKICLPTSDGHYCMTPAMGGSLVWQTRDGMAPLFLRCGLSQ
jgi:hypothetical protein